MVDATPIRRKGAPNGGAREWSSALFVFVMVVDSASVQEAIVKDEMWQMVSSVTV